MASNPFTTPFTCRDCGHNGMEIESFPGPRCMGCHERKIDGEPPLTATELANLFRL